MNLSFIFATLTACCLLPFEGRIPVDQNTTEASTESYKGTSDLFDSDEVLHIKLSGNIRVLMADRLDNAVYHSLVLTYKGGDSNEVSINIKAKTRGNFRRKKENCKLPPILLNFTEESRKTLFNNQHKLKLVTPCQSDNYVIREYLVYKLYNLVTPKSFRVRLVSVTLNDTEKRKETSFYGILLEEDEQLAARSGLKILKDQKIRGEHTEQESFFKMALFQYMIGNTDWSVPYRHNIRVLAFDSLSIPYAVPYDFDHSGIVNAPYAMPPEELGLSSVQERRFRGYCMTDKKTLEEVIAFYKRKRDEFYNVYKGCRFIDARYVNSTQKFLDGFYETLNDPRKINAALAFPCDKNQPKIVVRGLNGQ